MILMTYITIQEAKNTAVEGRGVSILSRNQLPGLQSEPPLKTIAVENRLFDVKAISRRRRPSSPKVIRTRTTFNPMDGVMRERQLGVNIRNIDNSVLNLENTASAFNTVNGIPNTPMILDARQAVSDMPIGAQGTQSSSVNKLFETSGRRRGVIQRVNRLPTSAADSQTRRVSRPPGNVNIQLRIPLDSISSSTGQIETNNIRGPQSDGGISGVRFTDQRQLLDPVSTNVIGQNDLLKIVSGQLSREEQQKMLFPNPTLPPGDQMPYTGAASAWDRKPLPNNLDIIVPPIQRQDYRPTVDIATPPRVIIHPSADKQPINRIQIDRTQQISQPTIYDPMQDQGMQQLPLDTIDTRPMSIVDTFGPQKQDNVDFDTTGTMIQTTASPAYDPFPTVSAVNSTSLLNDTKQSAIEPQFSLTTPPTAVSKTSLISDTVGIQTGTLLNTPTIDTSFVEPYGVPPSISVFDATNVGYDFSALPNNENWAIFDPTSLPPNVNFTEIGPIVDMAFDQPIQFTSSQDINFQSSLPTNTGTGTKPAVTVLKDTNSNQTQNTFQEYSPDIGNVADININSSIAKPSAAERTLQTSRITSKQNNAIEPTGTTIPTHLEQIVPVAQENPQNPPYSGFGTLQEFVEQNRVNLPPPPPII